MDIDFKLTLPKGTGGGGGSTRGLGLACTHYCVWKDRPMGTCCLAQGTLPDIMWSPKWEKNLKKDMCTCIALSYSRNYHNIVNPWYFNKTLKSEKKKSLSKKKRGVPIMSLWKWIWLASVMTRIWFGLAQWVKDPALLWALVCKSQTQLGSGVAVAVMQVVAAALIWLPAWEPTHAWEWCYKDKKQTNKQIKKNTHKKTQKTKKRKKQEKKT